VSNLEFTDEILYFDIDESLEKQRLDLVNFVNKKLRLSLIDKHGIFTNSGTYAGLTIDRLTNAKCKLTITQEGTVYADECDFGTWYIDEITYNSSNNNVDLLLQDSLHLYKSQVVEYNQYDLVDDKNKPFNALDTINYLNSTLPQSIPFGYMSYVTNPSILNYNDYSDVNTKEDFKKYVPDEKGNALYTIASASDNTSTIVQMIYNSVFLIPLSRFSPNYQGFQMNSNQITYDTVLGNAPNDNTPDEWYVHNSYIYEYCHDLTFGFKDGFASDYIEYPAKSLLPSHKNENSLPLSDLSYNEYQSNYALKYTFDDIKSNQNENIANKHRPLGRATYYTTDDNGIKTSFLDVYPYQSTKHIFNPKTETITITDWYRYDDYIGYAFNYTENYKTYKYITIQRNIRYNGSLTYTTTGAKIRNDNLKPNKK
jgi:hypothetical protein